MNHVVLPHGLTASPAITKLAGPGTRALLSRVCALGAAPSALRAHVFGGACVGGGFGAGLGLGARNVDVVRETLRSHGVRLVGEDVGGARGRKVVFCTATGSARVVLL
jgi:chemotaxis protein CheD